LPAQPLPRSQVPLVRLLLLELAVAFAQSLHLRLDALHLLLHRAHADLPAVHDREEQDPDPHRQDDNRPAVVAGVALQELHRVEQRQRDESEEAEIEQMLQADPEPLQDVVILRADEQADSGGSRQAQRHRQVLLLPPFFDQSQELEARASRNGHLRHEQRGEIFVLDSCPAHRSLVQPRRVRFEARLGAPLDRAPAARSTFRETRYGPPSGASSLRDPRGGTAAAGDRARARRSTPARAGDRRRPGTSSASRKRPALRGWSGGPRRAACRSRLRPRQTPRCARPGVSRVARPARLPAHRHRPGWARWRQSQFPLSLTPECLRRPHRIPARPWSSPPFLPKAGPRPAPWVAAAEGRGSTRRSGRPPTGRRTGPFFCPSAHGIESAARQRMAAQHTACGQETAAEKAVALDGLCAVLRAAGQEAAGRRRERRNEELVEPDEGDTERPRQARDHGVFLLNWRRRDRNSASSRAYTAPGSAARAFTTMSTL